MVGRTIMDWSGFSRFCCLYYMGHVSRQPLLVECWDGRVWFMAWMVAKSNSSHARYLSE